jgi:predicted transcriptional regulator of viral defense system
LDTVSGMDDVGVAPSDLADWLIGRGQHFITTTEAAKVIGVPAETVPASLKHSRKAGKLVAVTKGAWVPVPPEYRSAGAPPASHFIDQLMTHLGHPYYVGLLSAAAMHGASHQSPMVFQVVTPARLRDRMIGRNRIQFLQRASTTERPHQQRNVPTGRIWVSTPEATVLDLAESPDDGGGLSNVATIIGELLQDSLIDVAALAEVSPLYPTAVIQRAGFLIDLMAAEVGAEADTDALQLTVKGSRYRALSPGDVPGEHDERWHVIVNIEIEHDL